MMQAGVRLVGFNMEYCYRFTKAGGCILMGLFYLGALKKPKNF